MAFSGETSSPASNELEVMVMDALARAIGLPETFTSSRGGGGALQSSATESALFGILCARTKALRHMRRVIHGNMSDLELMAKMTLYASDQAHSSVKKAAHIAGLGSNFRGISSHGGGESSTLANSMDVMKLASSMEEDRARGLTPVFVCASVGTTSTCAIDPVRDIAQSSRRRELLRRPENMRTQIFVIPAALFFIFFLGNTIHEEVVNSHAYSPTYSSAEKQANDGDIHPGDDRSDTFMPWLHIDAAYAGAATICEEYRWILDGVEYADSFLFSAHKWLFINAECVPLWVRDRKDFAEGLKMNPLQMKYQENEQNEVTGIKDLQLSAARKERSLKVWVTMRAFGLDRMKNILRFNMELAQELASLIRKDPRFEIVAPVRFGLVCFRLKGSDAENLEFRSLVHSSGRAFFSTTKAQGLLILRIATGGIHTQRQDIQELWKTFQQTALTMKGGAV